MTKNNYVYKILNKHQIYHERRYLPNKWANPEAVHELITHNIGHNYSIFKYLPIS